MKRLLKQVANWFTETPKLRVICTITDETFLNSVARVRKPAGTLHTKIVIDPETARIVRVVFYG